MFKNKRVLIVSSLHGSVIPFMGRDVAHGFRKIGWDVEVLRERWPGEDQVQPHHVVETVMWYKPDIIFALDYLRAETPELWPLDSVFVSWVQDAIPRLLSWRNDNPMLGIGAWWQPRDLILCSYATLVKRFADQGFPEAQIKQLKPGVNTDLFFEDGSPPDEFTVGFIANPGHPGFIDPKARYEFYTEPVRWLMEGGIPVKTWGHGWQTEEFGSTWQGMVRNGPDLRRAYSSVSANLHINMDCMVDEHQRPYESLACNRPVIARCKPGGQLYWGRYFTDKESLLKSVEEIKAATSRSDGLRLDCASNIDRAVGPVDYAARAKEIVALAEERLR